MTTNTTAPLEPIRLRHPIDPTVDCVFKALFGWEENKALLIHFLNSILRPASAIVQITYINPANDPRTEDEKLTIIDIRAMDERGVTYHIEMQLKKHKALPERMLHNWASLYGRLLVSGSDFEKLAPVISIWLLDHKLIQSPGYHHQFRAWDAAHQVGLSDHFQIHTLELKKWRRPAEEDDLESLWLQFFRDAKGWQELPEALNQNPQMRQAMTVLKHFSDDDKARYEYERRMQALSLQTTIDNEYRRIREDAARIREDAEKVAAALAEAEAKLAQTDVLIEQKAVLLQQEAARAEQEAARAEQEAARAEQEASARAQAEALARQAEARLQEAQQRQTTRAQSQRQHLRSIYTLRFNSPLPDALSNALDVASLETLDAWFPLFLNASAAELLALGSA